MDILLGTMDDWLERNQKYPDVEGLLESPSDVDIPSRGSLFILALFICGSNCSLCAYGWVGGAMFIPSYSY